MTFLSWLTGISTHVPRSIRKKRFLVVYHFEREFEAWTEFSLIKWAVAEILNDVSAYRIKYKELL